MEKDKVPVILTNISYMRIVATIAVVFLHTCSSLLAPTYTITVLNQEQYAFAFYGRECMRWTVPLFIMITGALLLKKNFTFRQCCEKYVFRMAAVLFLFGLPFAWIKRFYYVHAISWKMIYQGIVDVFSMNSWAHLWYLYPLTLVYLFLPVLQHIAHRLSLRDKRIVLLILYLLFFIMPEAFTPFQQLTDHVLPFGYWLFYLLSGYYVFESFTSKQLHKPLILLTGSTGIVILALRLISDIPYTDKIIHYDDPALALVTIFIFFLFLHIRESDHKQLLWEADRLCFGIYVIHPVFIHTFYSFFGYSPATGGYYPLMVIIYCMVFLVCSAVFVRILKKVSLFDKLL